MIEETSSTQIPIIATLQSMCDVNDFLKRHPKRAAAVKLSNQRLINIRDLYNRFMKEHSSNDHITVAATYERKDTTDNIGERQESRDYFCTRLQGEILGELLDTFANSVHKAFTDDKGIRIDFTTNPYGTEEWHSDIFWNLVAIFPPAANASMTEVAYCDGQQERALVKTAPADHILFVDGATLHKGPSPIRPVLRACSSIMRMP